MKRRVEAIASENVQLHTAVDQDGYSTVRVVSIEKGVIAQLGNELRFSPSYTQLDIRQCVIKDLPAMRKAMPVAAHPED